MRVDHLLWPAAVNSALLGTERSPLTLTPVEGPLGTAAADLARSEPDASAALLRVASAVAAYRRCGWIPAVSSEPTPPACPDDPRPRCTAAAASLLRRLLTGEHDSLLRVWIQLAADRGVRPPPDTLRELLDLGRRDLDLGRMVITVGGTRATWLASFNDDWSYAKRGGVSPEELTTVWETGDSGERLRAFEHLRRLDPANARALLEGTWAKESGPDRLALIGELAHGLSGGDETFLERSLDDKRKEVRQRAAELLSRIPESALIERMGARARALVSLGGSGLLQRQRIDVTLPDAEDSASLARDGIALKPPPSSGIGERAWWLAQIIALVPPSTWSSAWSLDPSAIVELATDHEWREPIIGGWLNATHRYHDEAWAVALWDREPVSHIGAQWGALSPERVFVDVAPTDRVDVELRRLIGAGHEILRQNGRVLNALIESRQEWSDALARAVAVRLKQYAGVDKVALAGEFGLRALIERATRAIPVSAIDAFTEGWPDAAEIPTWTTSIDQLASILRFRNELHLAFSEESVP